MSTCPMPHLQLVCNPRISHSIKPGTLTLQAEHRIFSHSSNSLTSRRSISAFTRFEASRPEHAACHDVIPCYPWRLCGYKDSSDAAHVRHHLDRKSVG